MRKLVGKRRFWSYKIWKLEEVSHEMLVLRLLHVESRFSGFLLLSQCVCVGEAAKPFLFEGFQAGCHVVLRGRLGTSWHFHVSANASKVVLCDRSNSFARLSADELHVSLQAQHWRPPLSFCVAGAALQTYRVACFLLIAWSRLREVVTRCKSRGRRGMLWHAMTFHTPHSTLHTLHSALHTLHFTL